MAELGSVGAPRENFITTFVISLLLTPPHQTYTLDLPQVLAEFRGLIIPPPYLPDLSPQNPFFPIIECES